MDPWKVVSHTPTTAAPPAAPAAQDPWAVVSHEPAPTAQTSAPAAASSVPIEDQAMAKARVFMPKPPNPIDQAEPAGGTAGALATSAATKVADMGPGLAKGLLGAPGMAYENAKQAYEDFHHPPTYEQQKDRAAAGLGINRGAVAEAARNHDWSTLAAETAVPIGMTLLGSRMAKRGGVSEAMSEPAAEAPAATAASETTAPASAAPTTMPRGSIAQRVAERVAGTTPERMTKVAPGSEFSPAEVQNAATAHGVNLDLADSGARPIIKGVKQVMERSLGGSGQFQENTANNVQALEKWGSDLLSATDERNLRREQVGKIAQQKMQEHQQSLNDQAGQIFNDLDERVGDVKPDTATVQKQAQSIIDENRAYYEKHPELMSGATKRAWGIVNSLKPQAEKLTPVSDHPEGFETFAEDKPSAGAAKRQADTWSDLHKLRSDLMNEYRSPDIVGSRAEGWLKQMVEQVDRSMMDESSKLAPGDRAKFRIANDIYSEMKQTYDNPQHPFYHAVRALDGTTAGNAIANLKPEYIRQLREAMGKDFGIVQRDQISRLLDPNGDGIFDLKNLPSRLNRGQAEAMQVMLSPKQLKDLKLLAKTSQIVHASANPSGTSDVMVKNSELTTGNMIPRLASAIPRYGAAKLMTSPKVTEYLTQRGRIAQQLKNAPRGNVAAGMAR